MIFAQKNVNPNDFWLIHIMSIWVRPLKKLTDSGNFFFAKWCTRGLFHFISSSICRIDFSPRTYKFKQKNLILCIHVVHEEQFKKNYVDLYNYPDTVEIKGESQAFYDGCRTKNYDGI